MRTLEQLVFDNTYARLPPGFHARLRPTPLQRPHLVSFNAAAAELIDLHPDQARRPELVDYFGGRRDLPGSEPLAMLYAGHQFGHYVPQLGDGRAVLLGEVRNGRDEKWDLHLKGAGQTPFSRDGDGRAVLRSSIREYLCSEAMHGLGIPTSRALCLIGSEEEVYRERIETGAMLLRLAPSHVRFGSFEVFFYRGQFERLGPLADHVIQNHFPELQETAEPYLELLREVVRRTARLIAQWQLVGFAHGVMNTDNMSVLGLTLDYGPYGFLDDYDPGFICNHSDHHGRYAFDRQPDIGLWNLSCFAQALLPLLDEDGELAAEKARAALREYPQELARVYDLGMRAKLGLRETRDGDGTLVADLLERMHRSQVDYTNGFRALGGLRLDDPGADAPIRDQFVDRDAFDAWVSNYRARLAGEGSVDVERRQRMDAVNPKYVLRNYLAQKAIEMAERKDYSEIDRLLDLLRRPFDEQPQNQAYAVPPPDWGRRIVVSCSS